MRYCVGIASTIALWAGAALAEIEEARDLMEEGKFVEARELLWPAARSGNADAEELIGVCMQWVWGLSRTISGRSTGICAAR